MDEIKEGYIIDYISGLQVKETPEEVEAVQPFSKILVDDYGYPKSHVHTRPQYRVKVRPSDKKKEYPVDIAVFSSETHNEEDVYIIVGSAGADAFAGKISNESPIGHALIGNKTGDTVTIETPAGSYQVKILNVEKTE